MISEKELILKAKEGCEDAFEEIIKLYQQKVCSTIFYMVKNDIENEFFQPIAVSDTIAQDLELRALFDPQLSSAGEDN